MGEIRDLAEQLGEGIPAKDKVVVVEPLLEEDTVLFEAAEAVLMHFACDSPYLVEASVQMFGFWIVWEKLRLLGYERT